MPTCECRPVSATTAIKLVVMLMFATLSSLIAAQSDEQLGAKLIGSWKETRHVDCEQHRQRMELRANGTFEVAGFVGACNSLSAFVWRGTWKVVDRKFIYATTYSRPTELYPIGETFSDEIISLNDSAWEMLEQSTGNRSIATKVR
jgi:hypothetical protein